MPPECDHIPNVEGVIEVVEMSNREIRESLIAIARAVTMQVNLNMMPRVVESTMPSRLRNSMRMILLYFLALR